MTDKQIIIDGIKTSKVDFTDNFSIELTNCNIEERKQIGGRYFDIILRKEQECKNNKIAHQMELDIYNQECLNLQEELKETFEQLDQLKAENEELKEKFSYFHHPDVEFIQERNAFINEIKKNNKLKQTLAEIKKLAGEYIEIYFPGYYDEGTENDVVTEFANKILQKISEVEDEKSNN